MENKQEERVREELAELEHEQWVAWSKSVAENECLTVDRIARWSKLWIPYKDLTEEQKDQDRKWADKSLAIKGLRIEKDDQSLPDMVFYCKTCDKMVKNTMCNIVDDGWVKVIPQEAKDCHSNKYI